MNAYATGINRATVSVFYNSYNIVLINHLDIMDGKLPPWNIHGSHSSSISYTSGECQEGRDFIGESMPSLSSCMSGAFRALLPDYHGTSSAMTTNPVKYSYSPDDHCVIRSGAGMSYIENTIERRDKLDFIKDPPDEASVTHMLPSKGTRYVPQEKDRELDHRNSHNWTSFIKDALEISNGMEMGQTLSANICAPLVDLNPVYKELKPNKKQDGQDVKRGQDPFVAVLSDGVNKQQNVQEMGVRQRTNIFAEGSSLGGHEPVSLSGYYSSHNPHSLEGYMKYDDFSGIPFAKHPEEPALQKTSHKPALSYSPRKTLETSTKMCFKDARMHETENSTQCGFHFDLQKRDLQTEFTYANTSVNSQHHPSNYQEEMLNQSNPHVFDTTLTNRLKLENKGSTSPGEEGIESNLKTQGSGDTKNTELSLKVEAKFGPEIISSNQNSSSISENVPERSASSNKMHIDEECKDAIQEQRESDKLNTLCFQENCFKSRTVTLPTGPESINDQTDVCDPHIQEKQPPADKETAPIPSGDSAENSKSCEQTFFNSDKESNIHSTQHNLQNALQRYKKPRKRKKTELEGLNGWMDKSTKMEEMSDDGVKPDTSRYEGENCPLTDHDMTTLEKDNLLKYDVSPPSQSGRKTPKKSKIISDGEDFVTQSYVLESPCVSQLRSHEQPEMMADTAETSQNHFHEKDTPDAKNIRQMNDKNKPTQPVKKKVYGKKRKRKSSKFRLKAKISTIPTDQSLVQTNASPEEDLTLHSQVISSIQSSNTECKQAISRKSPKKKTQHTLQSSEDLPQTSNVCQTASQQEDTPSFLEADLMGSNVKKLQKARRPAKKAFVNKHDGLLDGESVSQRDSTSATDSSNIPNPQNNQRKPRQKKRADVSETAKTLKDSPAVFQQEDITSPLSKFKENMKTTKTTRPVKGKRQKKNVNDDHETAVLDVQTLPDILEQDSVSNSGKDLRTQKAFAKKVSKSDASSSPEKAVKARRSSNTSKSKTSDNQLNCYLDEETAVSQENLVLPLKIDTLSSRLKKSRKNTVTKIKDKKEQTLEINHTEYQHEDLTAIPDPIIASSDAQTTLKPKKSAKKTSRLQVKNEHTSALWDMQITDTLKQEDCPTSLVLNTSKKSKKIKKVSDIKGDVIHTPADVQTMPQQDILSLHKESEASSVPLKKRRFRTTQTLTTNDLLSTANENYESVHSNKVNGNPADSVTETHYLDVFRQQDTGKTKRSTKKVTRRKKNLIPAINSFGELSGQDQNSLLTSEKNINPTPNSHIEDIVNGTAHHGESRMFVSTEDSAKSSPKKPKKNWLKQIEKNQQELHHSITETVNNVKPTHEVHTTSDLPSVLKESVSENLETSEPNSCEQKWRAAKRKSKRSKEIAETYGFCVSLSEGTPTKIKTEAVKTDVMVTHTDMQNFSDDQTIKELQRTEKHGADVDQMDSFVKQEHTIQRPKVKKAPGRKKRKTAKKKKKITSLLPHRIKKEEVDTSSDNLIACDVQSQMSDNLGSTAITPEDPVESNMHISRKSSRIGIINSGPDIKTASDQVNSTVALDITESCTRLQETLSSSMNTDLNIVHGILIKKKRGRPRKHKLPVAHLEDNIQVADLSLCQGSSENPIQTADNQMNVVQRLKKKKGRKKKRKLTVTKVIKTDPSELSIIDPSLNTSSLSISRRGCKKKVFKAPGKNVKLSSLRVSSRLSEQGKTETSLLPQNLTKVLKKVAFKTSKSGREKGMKEKLNDRTTIHNKVVSDVKIEEITGRRGRPRKQPCFDLITQPEAIQQLNDFSVLFPRNDIKDEEESEQILLDTKIKAYTDLRSEKRPEISPEIEIHNTVNTFQPSEVQKVDGFTQYSEKHIARLTINKKIVSKAKEKVKKPLTCKYCGVIFRHITAYVMHRRIHTGEKPYKCKCGKTFAQLSKLKSHQKTHKQSDAFACPCCNQTFLKKEDLLSHFKIHLEEVNTKFDPNVKNKRDASTVVSSKKLNVCPVCKICNKTFVNKVKLHTHMQVHEAEKPLSCKDCGKKFWKSLSLVAHEKSHWPVKPYACSVCGKGFNQLKALKKHSQDHTGKTPFSCSHCGHAFSALSALRMHQASKTCIAKRNDGESFDFEGFIVSQGVEGQVNTPVFFKCQICKQLFKKWCQYTLHLQTHTGSSPYLCFSCGQCYEKGSEVNVHCEVCCQSSGEEKTCGGSVSEIMQGFSQTSSEVCSNNTSDSLQSTGLQTGPDVDTNQSPFKFSTAQSPAHSETSSIECIEISPSLWKFQCSRCGLRFERYRTLCAHMHTHAPAFRYTCAHCGQSFERWNKLWLHQRHHRAKGRFYSCTQCSLLFRFFSSYKEHMFEHAGQRPYACPLCPKTFIQEESLHAHQYESHQLRESLKCDVCSKTFSSLRNLVKHSLLHNGSTSHVCFLCGLSFTNTRALQQHLNTHAGYHGLPLPDVPSKALSFPHRCKRCKACFSTGDLLYAHQICHSRNAKTKVRPEVQSTSKASHRTDKQPPSQTNHASDLKLDGVPNDKSLYVYSHPDRLYLTPSLSRERHQVVHSDSNEHDSQNTSPEITNSNPSSNSSIEEEPTVTSQTDSTHLPQDTPGQENTNSKSYESIKEKANASVQNTTKTSRKHLRRSLFVETSINMDVESFHEELDESFECADCSERLTSVLGLYEHYLLHALGDTCVQVH